MGNDVILVLVVITALAFDFTNGFHDTGGWRVIRTLGKGLVEIESPQGMAAESSTATRRPAALSIWDQRTRRAAPPPPASPPR